MEQVYSAQMQKTISINSTFATPTKISKSLLETILKRNPRTKKPIHYRSGIINTLSEVINHTIHSHVRERSHKYLARLKDGGCCFENITASEST